MEVVVHRQHKQEKQQVGHMHLELVRIHQVVLDLLSLVGQKINMRHMLFIAQGIPFVFMEIQPYLQYGRKM